MEEKKKTTAKKPAAKKTTAAKKPAAKTSAAKKTTAPAAKKTSAVKKAAPKPKKVEEEIVKEVEIKEEPKKEEVKEVKSSNKAFLIALICIIAVAVIAGCVAAISLVGKDSGKSKTGKTTTVKVGKEKVKITKSEASLVSFDKFDNGLVSFEYPKGWKVEIAPADYIHYNFKVYNPDDPDYIFFFGLKFEGYMKSDAARNWQRKYYPSTMFAKLPAINPQTTEAFYKVWNTAVDYSNKEEMKYNYFNHLNDFKVVEKLGTNEIGGDILRATYTNDEGELNQGLFTATVKSAGTYYVKENPMSLSLNAKQIDVWPLMIYNIVYMSAPDAEFVNWQPILDKCLATIEFSQEFINGFNKEEDSVLRTIQANQKIYDQISDMIMDSWEKRSASYDRISQKQSDATLGYDRVYDTTTGDIYKADLDFMDHDWNGKYERVTDDMYTKPVSGYIEKVN